MQLIAPKFSYETFACILIKSFCRHNPVWLGVKISPGYSTSVLRTFDSTPSSVCSLQRLTGKRRKKQLLKLYHEDKLLPAMVSLNKFFVDNICTVGLF